MEKTVGICLRMQRSKNKYTLTKIAKLLEVDPSYISKVEKNKIQPPSRRLKQLVHFYKMDNTKLDYCSIDLDYILNYFNALYTLELDTNQLDNLNKLVKEHESSFYIGHILLIKYCYELLTIQQSFEFKKLIHLYNDAFDLFAPFEQRFLVLNICLFYALNRDENNYSHFINILQKIPCDYWQGLEFEIKIIHGLHNNQLSDVGELIRESMTVLSNESNIKRLYCIRYLNTIYLRLINDYESATKEANDVLTLCKDINFNSLTGLVLCSLGHIYFFQNKYADAAIYYEQALSLSYTNEFYYYLAYINYKLNNPIKAQQYIDRGRESPEQIDLYSDLMDWLEEVLITSFTKKTLSMMIRIERIYYDLINSDYQTFIFQSIIYNALYSNEFEIATYYFIKNYEDKQIVFHY